MQSRPQLLALAAALACPLPVIGSPAQESALEEVLVSARKRPENHLQVPVAVSVVSGEDIRRAAIADLGQLQQLVPSLSVDTGSSSNAARFGIRGMSTGSENIALESSVGLYVDGVYRARQGAMVNNLFDIEQIEVLRGPQGSLFGRNTPAGAVLLSTTRADRGDSYVELGTGSDQLMEANAAFSTPVSESLALRFSGFSTRRDGTVSDVNHGEDHFNNLDRYGLRAQALYTPSADLAIRVIADWAKLQERCCAAGSWKSNFYATDLPPGSAPRPGSDSLLQQLGATVIPGDEFYRRRTALSTASRSSNEDGGLSIHLDWQVGGFTLASISALREFRLDDYGDADFADIAALEGGLALKDRQYSQELRLSQQRDSLYWVAGLYGYHQQSDADSTIRVGEDLGTVTGLGPVAFPAGSGAYSDTTQDSTSLALFAQGDLDLTETVVLSAGLRWNHEKKDLHTRFSEDAPPSPDFSSPGWGFWLFPPLTPRPDAQDTLDDAQVTGTLKLSWQLSDHSLLYASWGSGHKSGGINTARLSPTLDPVFDAETSRAYELGLKTALPSQALRLSAVLHHSGIEDMQTLAFNGIGFSLQNAAEAEVYGAELDLRWQASEQLALSLAYAYNHAEYSRFTDAPCWVGTPWHTGSPDPGDNGDGSCDRSGDRLPGNPEQRAVLGVHWTQALAHGFALDVAGDYSYSSERITAQNNDPESLDGSYTLLNLQLGLNYQPWQLRLSAWGRNLTDEKYRSVTADAPLQAGRFIAFYNAPRSWGVSVRKGF